MSDIKNEIALEEIKEAVEHLKNTGNFGQLLALSNAENGTNRVNHFFVNTIISLITTIESLQKSNEYLEQRMKDNHSQAVKNIILYEESQDIVESLQNEIASHAPEGRNYTNGQ